MTQFDVNRCGVLRIQRVTTATGRHDKKRRFAMEGGMEQATVPTPTKKNKTGGRSLRFGRTALVAAAGTLAMLMVGSVLALLTDTVTFDGASATSNGFVDEATMDLRVKFGDCVPGEDIYDTAMFSDDTVMTFDPPAQDFDFAAIYEVGSGEGLVDISPRLCLANAGDGYGSLDVSIVNLVSTEVGTCSATEAAAETALALSGCESGDQGELHLVTELVLREYCAGGNQMSYGAGAGDMWSLGGVADLAATGLSHSVGHLQPGESCTVDLELWAVFAAADDSLAAAMTDTMQLTIAVDLSDAGTL